MKVLNTNKRFLKLFLLTIVSFFCVNFSFAQLTVTDTQAINFGTFYLTGGAGGTITVGYDGSRTSTGDILLLSMAPTAQPAIFEIKLCPGGNVSVTFDATTTLTGSNGGSLTLDIGPTEKGPNGSIFATNSDCNIITPLHVGGTLHVPGTAISGTYTGSLAITINQQ